MLQINRLVGNFVVIGALLLLVNSGDHQAKAAQVTKRSVDHKTVMHNHLARRVFERACAASKDAIDEILGCLTGNEQVNKHIKPEMSEKCFKSSFGLEFDRNDVMKHKELVCNNRDKFEQMTTCVYKTASEAMDPHEVEKLTEALVDVGLCIINALDG